MKEYQIAIIFRKIKGNCDQELFVPYKVVDGEYDEKNECFVDQDGVCYFHIISNPDDFGFCYRIDAKVLNKMYSLLPVSLAKRVMFFVANRYNYQFIKEDKNNNLLPTILFYKNCNGEKNMLLDNDILFHYYSYYNDKFKKQFRVIANTEEKVSEDKISDKPIELKNNIDLYTLYKGITDEVIDQDEPIMKIVTAIWKHYKEFSKDKSRNILINGSTGVGKTEIFRVLKKLIDIPYVIVDANDYTAAGYQGKNIEDMLISLLNMSNGDLQKAENGILIIDEIDKLSQSDSKSSQVNERDVQESLLKLLEDKVYTFNYNMKTYSFDTSKLLVVCMGSCSRIDLTPKRSVGFNSVTEKKTYKDITREDIVANGMIPEFVGRFPVLVQMNELKYDSFVKILKSKNSIINTNIDFFKKLGVDLNFNDSAINAIAKEADKNNYGARGLDEIIEKALSIATFEVGCCPGIYSKLTITEDTIEDNKKYVLEK